MHGFLHVLIAGLALSRPAFAHCGACTYESLLFGVDHQPEESGEGLVRENSQTHGELWPTTTAGPLETSAVKTRVIGPYSKP